MTQDHGSNHDAIYRRLDSDLQRINNIEPRVAEAEARLDALEADGTANRAEMDQVQGDLAKALEILDKHTQGDHAPPPVEPEPEPQPEPTPGGQSNRPMLHLSDFGTPSTVTLLKALREIDRDRALLIPDGDYLTSVAFHLRNEVDLVCEGPGVRFWQSTWSDALFRTPGLKDANLYFNGATAGVAYPMEADGVTRKIRHPNGDLVRGGGKIIEPRAADGEPMGLMEHVGVFKLHTLQHPGWGILAFADYFTMENYQDDNALQPQSRNIDDGIDIIGQHHRYKNLRVANHDDCVVPKSYGRETRDIVVDGLYMTGSDVGLAFGSDIWADIWDAHFINVLAENCGSAVTFKGYNGRAENVGHVRDCSLTRWVVKGRTYRYADFYTPIKISKPGEPVKWWRQNTVHDIDFVNWDLSEASISNETDWKDFGGGATRVLHAERQGPNLNGLAAIA